MATQAWKDKRIEATKAEQVKAEARKAKAQETLAAADFLIDTLAARLKWLEAMPVDDADEAPASPPAEQPPAGEPGA